MNTYESKNKAKTVTAIVSIIVIAGLVVVIELLQNNAKSTSTAAVTSSSTASSAPSTATSSGDTSTPSTSSSASASTTSTYKDGTYTADAEYYVPHGYEDIQVTLTIANGTITSSSIVNSESDHDSLRYQEEFASAYKTYVVGKSISDLKLSYVAGASDTTSGFNDALAKIKTQAQA